MARAIAFANNDVAEIIWHYSEKLPGCLGFAVYRKEGTPEGNGGWEALPSWVGFQGQTNPSWKPHQTNEWPIQKFEWKDLSAKRGGSYCYRIVPAFGQPGDLSLDETQAVTTGAITLTPERGVFRTYFNRGILSTQFLAHQIPSGPSGVPDYKVLTNRIDQPGDPLRNALAGEIIEGLELLLKRSSQEGGSCYLALYELNDPELIQLLLQGSNLHLILSNTGPDDRENQPVRQALHERDGIEMIDRFVPGGHIGHNKFCVYVDAGNTPRAVLLGSTNWTDTGLCAQSNNALVAEDSSLAATYLSYWKRLKEDTPADGHAKQGAALRNANALPGAQDVKVDEGLATVWFAPNTPHARSSHPGDNEAVPPDLDQVFELMANAKQAILFLEFMPGRPSVIDKAAEVAQSNPKLFVRGAVTDQKAAAGYATTLQHRVGEEPVVVQDEVVPVAAISSQFAYWQKELLKAGPDAHAIIHDKIVVIDPLSPNCIVVTGSHNHGYRASYNNDENLLIVRGHQALAQAYAVHVMDIYDHYRFRHVMEEQGDKAFSGLDPTDHWQDKYYDPSKPASGDAGVWFPG